MDTEQPAGIGHNNPPIAEVVAELFAPHADRVRPWVEAAGRVPDIDNPATAADAVTLAARLAAEWDDVDAQRKAVKAPHLDAGRIVDAAAAGIASDLEAAQNLVVAKVRAWMDRTGQSRINSEYGAAIYTREIVDYSVADARALGYWLMQHNPDALSDALLKIAGPMAKAMKVKPGEDRIPGLRAVARTTTVVKGS